MFRKIHARSVLRISTFAALLAGMLACKREGDPHPKSEQPASSRAASQEANDKDNMMNPEPMAAVTDGGALRLADTSPIKIMPLGDSITYGFEGLAGTTVNYGGYRAPLFRALNATYPGRIDFVGSITNQNFPGDPAGVDPNQEGHSGWTSEDLANNMATWLKAANPNYILLMIGSNDQRSCFSWTKSEGHLNSILNASLSTASVKRILVATVTPLNPDSTKNCRTNASIASFNSNLKLWVAARAKENKPVQFVDMNGLASLSRDDFSDGLHPNTFGYAKMAKVWLNALTLVLSKRGDASSDNKADIYWHNVNNQNLIWEMDGSKHTGDRALPNSAQGWEMNGTADFNGDGTSDIVWRNYDNGGNLIWLMSRDSRTVLSSVNLPPISDRNWHIVGTADMSGDGFPDIEWQNYSSMETSTWVMGSGGVLLRMMPLTKPSQAGWKMAGLADFNRDGYVDQLWRSETGANLIWFLGPEGQSKIGEQALQQVGLEWTLGGVGDFNGDGSPDIAWHNNNTLSNRVWLTKLVNGAVAFDNLESERSQANWQMQGPK